MLDGFLCPPRHGDDRLHLHGEKLVLEFRVAPPPMTSYVFYTLHLNPERQPSTGMSEDDHSPESRLIDEAKAVATATVSCSASSSSTTPANCPTTTTTSLTAMVLTSARSSSSFRLVRWLSQTSPAATNNVGILSRRCYDSDGGQQNGCPVVTAELCYMVGNDGAWRTIKPVLIGGAGNVNDDHLVWWQTERSLPLASISAGWIT